MEKMDCDIIQDLIPSYVDEICSEASKACVEEHLEHCESCKKIADLCRRTAFSATAVENKQLDGLKRWKKKIKGQNLISCLLVFLGLFGLYTFEGHSALSIREYYILFLFCLIGICLFTTHHPGQNPTAKADWIMIGSSVILNIISPLLLYSCMEDGLFHNLLYRHEPSKIGPLFGNFLFICFILQLLFTIGLLLNYFRQSSNNRFGLCITLSGMFLALTFRALLGNMDTLADFQHTLAEITLVVLVIGYFATILTFFRNKK